MTKQITVRLSILIKDSDRTLIGFLHTFYSSVPLKHIHPKSIRTKHAIDVVLVIVDLDHSYL